MVRRLCRSGTPIRSGLVRRLCRSSIIMRSRTVGRLCRSRTTVRSRLIRGLWRSSTPIRSRLVRRWCFSGITMRCTRRCMRFNPCRASWYRIYVHIKDFAISVFGSTVFRCCTRRTSFNTSIIRLLSSVRNVSVWRT